jgi:hypothetical protein
LFSILSHLPAAKAGGIGTCLRKIGGRIHKF